MQCSDKKINMNKPIVDALKNLGNRRKIFIKNLKNLHDFFFDRILKLLAIFINR